MKIFGKNKKEKKAAYSGTQLSQVPCYFLFKIFQINFLFFFCFLSQFPRYLFLCVIPTKTGHVPIHNDA